MSSLIYLFLRGGNFIDNVKPNDKKIMNPLSDIVFKSLFCLDENYTILSILFEELYGITFDEFETLDKEKINPTFVIRGKNKKGKFVII